MRLARGVSVCLYVLTDPSMIDLTAAPRYFFFFIETRHKDDSQAEISKLGFPFQIKKRDKETFLK